MQSKLYIDFDFDANQPQIRIELPPNSINDPRSDDLRDNMLKSFVQQALLCDLKLVYPDNNMDNRTCFIRIVPYFNNVSEN